VDGAGEQTAADSTTAAGSPTNVLSVAARGGGNLFAGDVGEVLVYSRPLSAGDRVLVRSYLAAKWGI
jgi:hypothetical protein